MDTHPPLELDRRFVPGHRNGRATTPAVDRLVALSSWMMVLGTVRLVCVLSDYASAFADAIRVAPLSMRMLSRLAEEIHPVVALSSAWPLILAVALRRTRWPQLVPAAAATFLVLSLGGIVEFWLMLGHASASGAAVGSFHLSRRAFLSPHVSDLALGGLGAAQLMLELATAIRALLLMPHLRNSPVDADTKADRARRARYGRMALYASFGFLFVVIRLPVWTTYLEVLNKSPLVRDFVLKSDNERLNGRRIHVPFGHSPTDEQMRVGQYRASIALATEHSQFGRFADARDGFQKTIDSIDSLSEDSMPDDLRQDLQALALNNLAWLEATCSDPSFRNPREAVRHARRATVLKPDDGNYWNTLVQRTTAPANGTTQESPSTARWRSEGMATASIGSSCRSSSSSWESQPKRAAGTTRPSNHSARTLHSTRSSIASTSSPLSNSGFRSLKLPQSGPNAPQSRSRCNRRPSTAASAAGPSRRQ